MEMADDDVYYSATTTTAAGPASSHPDDPDLPQQEEGSSPLLDDTVLDEFLHDLQRARRGGWTSALDRLPDPAARRTAAPVVVLIWTPEHGTLYAAEGFGDVDVDLVLDDVDMNLDDGGGRLFGAVPASGVAIACLPESTAGEDDEEGECPVCLEGYAPGDALRTLPCSHGFHEACIFGWLRVSRLCPLCRYAMPAETDDTEEGEDAEEDRG